MANSTFSGLTDRAGGALSGLRDRLGGSRRQDRQDDGYADYGEYGYDEYADYADYGEYGYGVDDPYDDFDDVVDVGEVRTRNTPSNARNHPPLVSFDEARKNSYVPDRLLRDPLEDTARSSRYGSGSARRTRLRDSVNVGHASEYDFASVGGAKLDEKGVEIPPIDAAPAKPAAAPAAPRTASQAGAPYDPYASYQGSGAATHTPTRKLKVLTPVDYGEVESIARALKAGDAVVLSLSRTPNELAKRVLDFSFGVASALDASVDCVASKVFAISRGQGLTDAERATLQSQGIL